MKYVIVNWDRLVVDRFLKAGHVPILVVAVQDLSSLPPAADRHPEIEIFTTTSFTDVRALTNLAGRLSQLGTELRVHNFLESTQYAAAFLGGLLGSPSSSLSLTLRTRDKRVMKAKLREFGIPLAKVASIDGDVRHETVQAALLRVGRPAIAKPADGRGSKDLSIIRSEADLKTWLAGASNMLETQWLFEELIEGDEFHADTVWVSGCPRYCLIGRYERPPRIVADEDGSNATVYLARAQHERLYAKVEEMMLTMCRALDIKEGVTHAEFFERPNGELVFSEVATRPAGGGHDDCVRILLGEGLKELGVRSVVDSFLDAPNPDAAYRRTVGFVNLVPFGTGYISQLPAREKLIEVPGVVDVVYAMQLGQFFEKYGACSWCVMPIVEAITADECLTRFALLRQEFTVSVSAAPPNLSRSIA